MPDFWRHSGFHLLDHDALGLRVNDDFLRAYLARPELLPVAESCARETALHRALLDDPRMAVDAAALEAIADADARDNYRLWLAFRGRLLDAETLEAAYSGIFRGGDVSVPPLFIDQLVQVILRSILDGCDDPLQLRAAELLYREQRVSVDGGEVLLADCETVDARAAGANYGSIGKLLREAQAPLAGTELEVLDSGNAAQYWDRDERHDFVLAATQGRPGIAALAKVLETWVMHFLGVKVRIVPVPSIEDRRWVWHIGLDAAATAILNDLYRGDAVDSGRLRQILALFRLEFADPRDMRPDLAGRAVYLGMAMDEEGVLRLKPQNLLLNLPLAGSG
jgi:hypothetical protein